MTAESAFWQNRLFRDTRKNAIKRCIPWGLTLEQFKALITASGMRCAVSGILLDLGRSEHGRRPFYPSLDRKNSAEGYTVENCRIVCVAANLAMNQWGEEVLKKLAIGFFIHQKLEENIKRGDLQEVLPDNVKVRRTKKGFRYGARVRQVAGKDIWLGTFKTASEAAAAQEKWMAENSNGTRTGPEKGKGPVGP